MKRESHALETFPALVCVICGEAIINFEEKVNLKRFAAWGAILLLAAVVSAGCGGSSAKIAARVNKDTITEAEFFERVQYVNAANLAPALQGRALPTAGEYAMQTLIGEKLLMQIASEKKAVPSDSDITSYVTLAKKYMQQNPQFSQITLIPPDPFRTDADWRRDARIAVAYRNLVMASVKLTPYDSKKLFEQIKAALGTPEKYHLRLIDVKSQAKAQSALETLKKGVPFQTVALTQSEDKNSAQRNGDIGEQPAAQLPPPLLEAVKNLKPEEYAPKIVSAMAASRENPNGPPETRYFLVQLVEKKPAVTPTFEEVKPLCENIAAQQKDPGAFQRVQQSVKEYQDKANIQINLKRYENLFKKKPAAATGGAPPK